MSTLHDFIASGILELYAMGQTSPQETEEVERMTLLHPEVQSEIEAIRDALEAYATAHAVEPNPIVKYMLMATIDFTTRIENGEPVSSPPLLHAGSKPSDYAEWLNREDLKPPLPLKDVHVRIIGYSPEATLAVVWMKEGAPPETHTNEQETFLIVEGSCDIYVDGVPKSLKAGDVYSIPLHKPHWVKVTSDVPCKVILQRKAA
ncbi:MAG TPA: cupin domain-containing protein [Chitinophagales bacterium]|nr:cupin domain-containing protein [Chitinophagales bacterium]